MNIVIKPLVWTKKAPPGHEPSTGWYAEGVGGWYHWEGETLWRVDDAFTFIEPVLSLAAAKAWAQPDHEKRVRSLIFEVLP